MELSNNLRLLENCAKKSARTLLRDYGEIVNLQTSHNPPKKFAEVTLLRTERSILEELDKARPEYGIISRDVEVKSGQDLYFVVNPIDGFDNFCHGFVQFGLSISIMKRTENKDETIAIYANMPALASTYVVEKGQGAYRSDFLALDSSSRARVSSRKKLDDGIIFLAGTDLQNSVLGFKLYSNFFGKRVLGSTLASCAYAASGFGDLVITNTNEYSLFIQEAGGFVRDLELDISGKKHKFYAYGNDYLLDELEKFLQK